MTRGPDTEKVVENIVNLPIHQFLGLRIDTISAELVVGRMQVTKAAVQPFDALHGGVSGLVAESLASLGGIVAANGATCVGVELHCSHLRGVPIGTHIVASARPLRVGRTLQVWEVHIFEDLSAAGGCRESNDRDGHTAFCESQVQPGAHLDRKSGPDSERSKKDALLAVARVTLAVRPIPPTRSNGRGDADRDAKQKLLIASSKL